MGKMKEEVEHDVGIQCFPHPLWWRAPVTMDTPLCSCVLILLFQTVITQDADPPGNNYILIFI